MIERFVLLGATGDLAGRFLFPALAELHDAGQLPANFDILAAARQDLDDEGFRQHIAQRLEQHGAKVNAKSRAEIIRRTRFIPVDLMKDDLHAELEKMLGQDRNGAARPAVALYLALPPNLFLPVAKALTRATLPAGSRIIVEKPFGESLDDAIALNRVLRRASSAEDDVSVFRVDHVLGMATVHNLLGVRLANRILEPLWNSQHIEQVDILWEETIALEGRAGYYDKAGALKDVMQNHMLQILALVAMEPPPSLTERELRDRKVDVLRAVRPPDYAQMATHTRRARYTAGTLADTGGAAGNDVPDYASEQGVDPARSTETFAEVVLTIDNWRWVGTKFVLRAGKALHRRWKGVIVRFRPPPHMPFDVEHVVQSELRIGLDGPESLTLQLAGSAPGPPPVLTPLSLHATLGATGMKAYSHVLHDVLSGDCALSSRGDEAEEAWRIMTPVVAAWKDGAVPLEEYPAGSSGPPRLSVPDDRCN